jgi:hypothetical protein
LKLLSPLGFALLAATLCGCGSDNSHMKSDWEIANEGRLLRSESDAAGVEPPAFPRRESLIGVDVPLASGFSFFVDSKSVSLGSDRVVRYALVARSPSGVDNVSYEGISCGAGEFAVYAIGLADGKWRTVAPQWKPIERKGAQRWHGALYDDYFCPGGTTIGDAAEGVAALKQGGNPLARRGAVLPSGPSGR